MGIRRRLRRGELFLVAGIFAAIAVIAVGVVAGVKRRQTQVDFDAVYYFLVEDCESSTAAAVAGKVYSSGGAGYLLHGDAVVVACYYTVQDAERVQAAMREKGKETRIAELSAETVTLYGGDVQYGELVTANISTVETCARLLYDAANGLERAEMGQTEARAAARGAADSLGGLKEKNPERFFGRWNAALALCGRECREISEELVFARDLRRAQAQLLCMLVELGKYF